MVHLTWGIALLIAFMFGNEIGRNRFKSEALNWHKHYEEKMTMTISLSEQLQACKDMK